MEVKPYKIPHPFRKLTKELIDTIVNDIKAGSTHRYASEANGITDRILYIWIKQGKIDVEVQNDSLCAYLVRSLASVKQEEIKWCREVIKADDRGHKGAEWTLEHAYWRDFGKCEQIKVLADQIDHDALQTSEDKDETDE